MEHEFIECAIKGYLAACRDNGYIIPKYAHLEKLALETVGRKDFEMLDAGGESGATQAFIREMLCAFLAERADHMNGR